MDDEWQPYIITLLLDRSLQLMHGKKQSMTFSDFFYFFSAPTNFTSCTSKFMFHCKFEDKCVPYMFTCDGTRDCIHGSDENLPQCFGKIFICFRSVGVCLSVHPFFTYTIS